jgi:hypothetical protein
MKKQQEFEKQQREREFWCEENLKAFTKNMRLFVMAKSLISPVLQADIIERYKWISIKYDQERDNLFEKVYFDLLGVDKALYS